MFARKAIFSRPPLTYEAAFKQILARQITFWISPFLYKPCNPSARAAAYIQSHKVWSPENLGSSLESGCRETNIAATESICSASYHWINMTFIAIRWRSFPKVLHHQTSGSSQVARRFHRSDKSLPAQSDLNGHSFTWGQHATYLPESWNRKSWTTHPVSCV